MKQTRNLSRSAFTVTAATPLLRDYGNFLFQDRIFGLSDEENVGIEDQDEAD